ncbi:MAG: hypothetical protein QOD03_824 [Verrucomicrobiota bacterium]
MSHPLCQDSFNRKTNYDDESTNGTRFQWCAGLSVQQSASTAVEPGELVVSADARSRGQSSELAAGATCASRTDLFPGVNLKQGRSVASKQCQNCVGIRPTGICVQRGAKFFQLRRCLSDPAQQNGRKRKVRYDKCTNGTWFGKSSHLSLDQSAATAIEPRQLVVSTDA